MQGITWEFRPYHNIAYAQLTLKQEGGWGWGCYKHVQSIIKFFSFSDVNILHVLDALHCARPFPSHSVKKSAMQDYNCRALIIELFQRFDLVFEWDNNI